MASVLRQIVAGPRARHSETGLDLCYVTDNLIATSGPASLYPKRAYRNPTDELVRWLDAQHGAHWHVWEFRAEGTGYPDEEVHGRIHHFPFPDHHPPPFAIIPRVVASMRNWLLPEGIEGGTGGGGAAAVKSKKQGDRVAVIHCKAGKGRTGTMICSYLMSEEGWTMEAAMQRFTERRMRTGFGEGVTIPSQRRYLRYVDAWVRRLGKVYVERPVEVLEVHVWGLRDGVQLEVDGFLEEGRRIGRVHRFGKEDLVVVDDGRGEKRERGDEDRKELGVEERQQQNRGRRSSTFPMEKGKSPTNENSAPSGNTTRSGSARSNASTERSFQSLTNPNDIPELIKSLNPFQSSKSFFFSTSSTPSAPNSPSDDSRSSSRSRSVSRLKSKLKTKSKSTSPSPTRPPQSSTQPSPSTSTSHAVILRPAPTSDNAPSTRILLPTSDINISMERRVSAAGLTMATTLAHVWFNAYFEGGHEHDSGVFEVDWEEMDGIKGTGNKGLLKGFDRVSVVWRYVGEEAKDEEGSEGKGEGDNDGKGKGKDEVSSAAIGEEEADKIKEYAGRSEVEQVVKEPAPGEEVPETKPADWRGDEDQGEKGLYVKMKHTASE